MRAWGGPELWLILRGHGLTHEGSPGNSQYAAEALLLCDREEFCRPEFSAGDQYIFDKRFATKEFGSPLTWLRAGINHHLVFALRQIAAFVDAPSTSLRNVA